LPSGLVFCIWLAWIIQYTELTLSGRTILITLIAIAFITGIYQHITYQSYPYGPFKEIDAQISQRKQPEDLVIHSYKLSILPAIYFDRDLPQTFIADPPSSPKNTLAPATQQVLNIEAESDIRSAVNGADRVWYIIYQRYIDEYIQAKKDTHPDIEFLKTEYVLESQETRGDVQIFLFTKKP